MRKALQLRLSLQPGLVNTSAMDITDFFSFAAKSTVKKNCFLSPGSNDTCFVNDSGEEVCWCHTDFCNKASLSTIAFHHWISALILPLIAYHLVVTWKNTLSSLYLHLLNLTCNCRLFVHPARKQKKSLNCNRFASILRFGSAAFFGGKNWL